VRGRFIALEGLDGAGISTQTRRLAVRLDRAGVNYYCTREPTDGPVGSQIRLALIGRLNVDPTTLALMFAADRSDHLHHAVAPRLEAGVHVVTERQVLSSLAYQGAQLGDRGWVREINRENLRFLAPDLTVFLDVPPQTALKRIDAGRHARELFERADTLAATRTAFLAAMDELRADGHRFELVDATQPIDEVEEQIAAVVLASLKAADAG
jgi:dTMP kinase